MIGTKNWFDDDEDWAARRPWGRLPTKRVWLLRTYARKRAVPSQVLSQCRSKSRATVVGWPTSRLTRPTGPTRAGQLPPIARERQCPSQAAVDRCPTGPVMRVPIEKFLIYERLGLRKQRWCGVSGQGGRDRGSADAPVALTESLDRMKCIFFYKIMCFTKQIYRRQILIAKPRFYF